MRTTETLVWSTFPATRDDPLDRASTGAADNRLCHEIGHESGLGLNKINKRAEDAAKAANVRLIVAGPSGQGALAGQIYAIQRVISEGAKAIAIAPIDSTGIVPIVQHATARGTPFIAVDTAIDDPSAKRYVGTDNVAASRSQAEWVAGAIGDTDERSWSRWV